MDVEQERINKQTYLKAEIIDKGFDANAFISFCEQEKGADVDNWSLDELKDCVSRFIAPPKQFSNADLVECKTLRPSALNGEVVKVVITKPEKKPGTFSSKDFFYFVVTMPLGWSVQRKVSDFKWLTETLNNEFPGLYIPVIKEKSSKQLEDPLEMSVQVKQMTYFISYILTSDLLKRSQSFVSFLQVEERSKFSKIKKIKMKKPQESKNFCSSDGRLTCEYDNFSDFSSKMINFCDLFKDSFHKLSHEGKNLKRILCELALSMNSFTTLFSELSQISSGMFVHSRPAKILYSKLAETCSKFSDKIWNSTVVSFEYFHGDFNYFKYQGDVIKNLFKEKDLVFSEAENLKKKIGKIVEKDKGVNKETTDKLKGLKEKAGVLNYLCKDQSEKLINYYVNIVFQDSLEYCQKSLENLTGMMTIIHSFQDVSEASQSLLAN